MKVSQFWSAGVLTVLLLVSGATAQTTNRAGLTYLPPTLAAELDAQTPNPDFWPHWGKEFSRRTAVIYTDRFPGAELDWTRTIQHTGYGIHNQINHTGYALIRDGAFKSLRDELAAPFEHVVENQVASVVETFFAGSLGSTAEEDLELLPQSYSDNEKLWLAHVPPVGDVGYGFRPWDGYAYLNARLGSRLATDVRYHWDMMNSGKVAGHLVYKLGSVRLVSGIAFTPESANQAEWSTGIAYDSRQFTCYLGMSRQGSVSGAVTQASLSF